MSMIKHFSHPNQQWKLATRCRTGIQLRPYQRTSAQTSGTYFDDTRYLHSAAHVWVSIRHPVIYRSIVWHGKLRAMLCGNIFEHFFHSRKEESVEHTNDGKSVCWLADWRQEYNQPNCFDGKVVECTKSASFRRACIVTSSLGALPLPLEFGCRSCVLFTLNVQLKRLSSALRRHRDARCN